MKTAGVSLMPAAMPMREALAAGVLVADRSHRTRQTSSEVDLAEE